MSLIKQLAGQTAIYGLSNILGRVLHFVVFTFYLSRKFEDPSLYGAYLELYTYSAILLLAYKHQMETAYFRYGSNGENKELAFTTAFTSIVVPVILLTSVFWLFADYFGGLLRYKSDYIKWFALILAFDSLSALPFAKMRMENKASKFALIKILNIVLTIALVLFFFDACPWLIEHGYSDTFSFFDPANLLDYVFISNLIASAVMLLMVCAEFKTLTFRFDIDLWKKMMVYSIPLIIVAISGEINKSIATPLQRHFLQSNDVENLAQAGIYGAAAKLALLMNLIIIAYNYAAEPFFFKQAEETDHKKTYADVALIFTIVITILGLGLVFYVEVIAQLLGPNYREALYLTPVLVASYILLGMYYNFAIWYKITDNTKMGAYISIGGVVITLLANILLLPTIGYDASAWASFACFGFMVIAGYLLGQRYYPIPYASKRILMVLVLGGIFFALGNSLSSGQDVMIVRLLIKTLVLISFTTVVLYFNKSFIVKALK